MWKFFASLLLVLLINNHNIHCESPAEIISATHQVSIRLSAADKIQYGSGHICSGVLITDIGILTAASCLMKNEDDFYVANELNVAMGLVDKQDQSAHTLNLPIVSVKTHGRFNKHTLANNLALLKVDHIEFGVDKFVIPKLTSRQKIAGNEDCYVNGWRNSKGEATQILMQSNVTAVRSQRCKEQEKSFPLATFCTRDNDDGGESSRLSECVGEVGAGLICQNELRGVVSRNCDNQGGATQFTDVSQLFNWIFLAHVDDDSYKLIDNEYLRYFLFSVLDFFAYYIGTDKIADDFEMLKFFF